MEKKSKKNDFRFFVGLGLIIFLVLINSFVKEIPWFIVAIPALIMGVDLSPLVEYFKSRK